MIYPPHFASATRGVQLQPPSASRTNARRLARFADKLFLSSAIGRMPLLAAQKHDIEEVIKAILNATGPRTKRKLAEMFMELPDKTAWPEYYEVRFEA